ncbi:TadE family protein [Dyella sp. EPa41]|uniref:TadE family protein n=1 Tax=Dyella sp. EPa41 TaxID=1561194 RepID=UPI0019160B50|nr:TadE family protein [Dyella sp. EPa41]
MKRRVGGRRQRGQSVVETCVVIAVFGTFLLGIFQMILFYRAKGLVDYAALEAARNGATHGVEMNAMRVGLARGLLPLYTRDPDKTAVATAYARAYADTINPLASQIQVISPTKAAFADWKVRQFDGVDAIPNDSLPYRSTSTGGRSGLTVQDANVLKIRVVYGYKMIVPVIDKLILGVYRLTFYQGMSAQEVAMLESGRLPIATQAMVRMQTPIRDSGLLP